ncbi:MAG: alpha/beta hydrolase [Chitinophagaceae bacterium]|nr:alpha/beta hydrolase [Chitinophagaceae bacterium]
MILPVHLGNISAMIPHISNKTAVIHHELHLNYTLSGTGDIALLFVHGAFLDETYWNAQVDYFSSSYQVITLDLAGHGKSGCNRTNWSIEQFGQDVIALLKVLQLKQVILIGHSMGADAILEAAILYPQPVIGFIAIDAFKHVGQPLPDAYQKQAEEITQKLQTEFADTLEAYARMALLTSETKPAITERIVQAYRNAYEPMAVESITESFDYYQRERELLQRMILKLYLINVDYMATEQSALDQYAAGSYELLSLHGTSHFPMIENPKELNDRLGEAITSITKNKNNEQVSAFFEDHDDSHT